MHQSVLTSHLDLIENFLDIYDKITYMDVNIESELSLETVSKLIDTMVLRHDEPSEIVSVLKHACNTSKPEDVFSGILTLGSIFSLDFALQCSPEDRDWLVDNAGVSPNHAAYFAWQTISSKSNKVNQLKFQLQQKLTKILPNGPAHPYKLNHSGYVFQLDTFAMKLSQASKFTNLAYLINERQVLSDQLMCGLSYSLFKPRLLQYDFFRELNPLNQYMLLRGLQSSTHYAKESYISPETECCQIRNSFSTDLLLQIINNAENVELKHMAYLVLKNSVYRANFISFETSQEMQECSSFGEFEFKNTISGKAFHNRDLVVHLLLNKRSWLKDWIILDKEEVDGLLKCSDLFDFIRRRSYK